MLQSLLKRISKIERTLENMYSFGVIEEIGEGMVKVRQHDFVSGNLPLFALFGQEMSIEFEVKEGDEVLVVSPHGEIDTAFVLWGAMRKSSVKNQKYETKCKKFILNCEEFSISTKKFNVESNGVSLVSLIEERIKDEQNGFVSTFFGPQKNSADIQAVKDIIKIKKFKGG